jgi:hypothetical protein
MICIIGSLYRHIMFSVNDAIRQCLERELLIPDLKKYVGVS